MMKSEYDLATMKCRKNPYTVKLKKPVYIRLDEEVISYYKQMATDSGVPYQTLINLSLRECVHNHKKITVT